MAGTKAGGKAAAQKNKAKFGSDFYRKIGAKGGSRTGLKGFAAMSFAERQEAGRIGGSKGRRNGPESPLEKLLKKHIELKTRLRIKREIRKLMLDLVPEDMIEMRKQIRKL